MYRPTSEKNKLKESLTKTNRHNTCKHSVVGRKCPEKKHCFYYKKLKNKAAAMRRLAVLLMLGAGK
jgi:hypothetical protein